MKPKIVVKIWIDVLLILTLFLLMGFQFWGDEVHEWIGVGIFALFFLHQMLNRNWYKNLHKGKYTFFRICGSMINMLLFVMILLLAYSSVVMSRYVFDFLEPGGSMSLARRLHILASYWGFILMSAHLGLHWSMVIWMAKKRIQFPICTKVSSVIGLFIASYGAFVFIKRDFLTYMFLKSEFVFMDYSEPKILFYLDHLALMGSFIFVFHYAGKIMRVKRIMEKSKVKQ